MEIEQQASPADQEQPAQQHRVPLPEGAGISAQAEAFLYGRKLPSLLMDQTVIRPAGDVL
ncbi:MAG TPA: hypothetical protein VD735_06120 [Candidatus Saccharimonadales bacterium]|nr:hypothetical protein [Candidatus Saccharimonadales bacterium]